MLQYKSRCISCEQNLSISSNRPHIELDPLKSETE
jgi:hypothetical protein